MDANDVVGLFTKSIPKSIETKNTSHGDDDFREALLADLGCVEENENAERIMLPEYGDKMVFQNCHPNYGGKGFLYLLDKEKFTHAMGSQWVCYEEIYPDDVIEISVDDYLDYCIIR